jgi:TonB family protein
MTAAPLPIEIQQPTPDLRLLVELPSWRSVFLQNLRDFVFPPRRPPLELRSTPAPFWADVFVTRPLPWDRFFQSGVFHVIVLGLLIGLTRFFNLQPQVVARPTFDHSQVVYQDSEYLPPLDTRSAQRARPRKADREPSQPALSRQPIMTLPREADNRSQTVVTAPNVKLKRDVALPNMVAWSEMQKPRLAIPPVPLTLAADTARIALHLENSVVTPPPDAADLTHRRNSSSLETSVVAPPPNLSNPNAAALRAPQQAVIAPPPSVETASARVVGDLNIGRSSVIAPAPQLPLSEQRSVSASRSSRVGLNTSQPVPPPPSVSAVGSSGESFGARGRVIALNLHPAVGAPPSPPQGNRRGAFVATPDGQPTASGSPGADARGNRSSKDKENAGGSTRKGTSDAPAGLYVGSAAAKPSTVAGNPQPSSASSNPASANSVNPNLMASLRPSHVTSVPPRGMQPEGTAKLSEVERQVFGDRKFYSLTLNMPNLNSAAGSWVIRFAELGHDSKNRDLGYRDSNDHNSNSPAANNHDANAASGELSQPTAIRKVDPAYPLQLMRQNVGGTVILYAIIRADGSVGNVRILRGVDERLDRFASQAVAQWQFQPASKNGSPVDVEATFQIPFRPQRVGADSDF